MWLQDARFLFADCGLLWKALSFWHVVLPSARPFFSSAEKAPVSAPSSGEFASVSSPGVYWSYRLLNLAPLSVLVGASFDWLIQVVVLLWSLGSIFWSRRRRRRRVSSSDSHDCSCRRAAPSALSYRTKELLICGCRMLAFCLLTAVCFGRIFRLARGAAVGSTFSRLLKKRPFLLLLRESLLL